MDRPPFKIPNTYQKVTRWAERKIPTGYSDGDARHWPGKGPYRPSDDSFYLCYLGQQWAEKDGIAEPGVQYYLDRLPEGYAMFEMSQPGGPQVYRRLFGHPRGRFYDSAARFEQHFQWLMSGMEGQCECVMCSNTKPVPKSLRPIVPKPGRPSRLFSHLSSNDPLDGSTRRLNDDNDSNDSSLDSSAAGRGLAAQRSQRQVRQTGAPTAVDEEGNEDVYKSCIKKLETAQGGKNGIEIDLTEDGSIDWKAERESLPQYLIQIEQQHSFIPRVGELVLWCPNFLDGHYLMVDPETSRYKFYSFEQKCFHGFPDWRGGIVAAVPSASVKNGLIDFPDILDTPVKKTAFNTAGFRIETMPDPNDDVDKSLSKQYRYVPLRQIRPLVHWRLLLRGIPRDKLHPSVLYALTCMTSISLLEKSRFNGEWPNARIFCKAIFLGSELITIGDTIRLLPSASKDFREPEVLVVDSIRYNLLGIKHEHTITDVSRLCDRSFISFVGSAYTTQLNDLMKPDHDGDEVQVVSASLPMSEVKALFRSVGTDEYGPWYPWHGTRQRYEVSHERVLGRLYEADAVRLWTGQRQFTSRKQDLPKPSLHFDADSVTAARMYATATDARLPEPDSPSQLNWHLADTRAESLAISTLNGIDVGKYHEVRTPATLKQWRLQVKIADGQPITSEIDELYLRDLTQLDLDGKKRGRRLGSKLIDGKVVHPWLQTTNDNTGKQRLEVKIPKPSSQMAGAALASEYDSSEEAESIEDGDLADIEQLDYDDEQIGEKEDELLLGRFQASKPIKGHQSKADIMNSVEVLEDDAFEDDISDQESWLDKPPPLLRGGTEETEGGDYASDSE